MTGILKRLREKRGLPQGGVARKARPFRAAIYGGLYGGLVVPTVTARSSCVIGDS